MPCVHCRMAIPSSNRKHLARPTSNKDARRRSPRRFERRRVESRSNAKHRRPSKVGLNEWQTGRLTFLLSVEYVYGFLAVFIVSALSLAGLLAFPIIYKVSFQYVLTLFTALAVGTLFGDTMFHLIPFVSVVRSKKVSVCPSLSLSSRHWVYTSITTTIIIIIIRFQFLNMSGKCC